MGIKRHNIFRICRNKYGYYKMQRLESHRFFWFTKWKDKWGEVPIDMRFKTQSINYLSAYGVVRSFKNKQCIVAMIEKFQKKIAEEEEDKKEFCKKNNDDWECEGIKYGGF